MKIDFSGYRLVDSSPFSTQHILSRTHARKLAPMTSVRRVPAVFHLFAFCATASDASHPSHRLYCCALLIIRSIWRKEKARRKQRLFVWMPASGRVNQTKHQRRRQQWKKCESKSSSHAKRLAEKKNVPNARHVFPVVVCFVFYMRNSLHSLILSSSLSSLTCCRLFHRLFARRMHFVLFWSSMRGT